MEFAEEGRDDPGSSSSDISAEQGQPASNLESHLAPDPTRVPGAAAPESGMSRQAFRDLLRWFSMRVENIDGKEVRIFDTPSREASPWMKEATRRFAEMTPSDEELESQRRLVADLMREARESRGSKQDP